MKSQDYMCSQGQAQNWGIIAITTLCRFLFLTRFWDDKEKALLVYGSPVRNCMVGLLLVGREGGRCTPFGEGPSRVGLMPCVWFHTYRYLPAVASIVNCEER